MTGTVRVNVLTDVEPIATFVREVCDAGVAFSKLSDTDFAALPEGVREGIADVMTALEWLRDEDLVTER